MALLQGLCISLVLSGNVIHAQGTDWGDAPDPPYPTLIASGGAAHNIIPGIFLGFAVDPEPNGQLMGPPAMGDDLNFDDADGVIFKDWLMPGMPAQILVIASIPGFLNAWIDFNGNGTWIDPIDQIFNNVMLAPGYNILQFIVPGNAMPGLITFARFRYGTVPGLMFMGLAPDGEVEDYWLVIGPPPPGSRIIDPDPSHTQTQNEISLAVHPGIQFGPPALLVAAYNDEPSVGGPGLGVSYSTDAGNTWGNTQIPYPVNPYFPNTFMRDAFDPSTTIDGAGNVYVSYISTDANWQSGPISGLYVNKSTDGCLTWSGPVAVSTDSTATAAVDTAYRFNDRDQITVDNYPRSPWYNRIYITWIKDRGWNAPLPTGDIYISWSANGGNSFSPPLRINSWNNNMGNMPVPDVARNGTVYVIWVDYNVQAGGKGVIFLDKSTDGGITWQNDIIVDTIDLPPLRLNNPNGTLAKGAAVIRVQPDDPNELYVVYAADPDGAGADEADIFFIRSNNGGISWTNPMRVNDDGTLNDQVLPWMDVRPNGIIEIAWYDRRNDPLDLAWDVFYTSSADRGTTFAPNSRINQFTFQPCNTFKWGDWFGEYLGLASDYNLAYAVHTSSLFDNIGDVHFTTGPLVVAARDYGDAPDIPYNTLYMNEGAFHNLDGITYLGAGVDAEPDGVPDISALGDDRYLGDDEDGVIFPVRMFAGSTDTLTVTASVQGFLNTWIDFDRDGSWSQAGNRAITDYRLNPGSNKVPLLIPDNTTLDTTYARFRFSTLSGISYKGEVLNGEVEDYLVRFESTEGLKQAEERLLRVQPNPLIGCLMHLEWKMQKPGTVNFRLTDLRGQSLAQSADYPGSPGGQSLDWNLNDCPGSRITPGIYIMTMTVDRLPVCHEKIVVIAP